MMGESFVQEMIELIREKLLRKNNRNNLNLINHLSMIEQSILSQDLNTVSRVSTYSIL